MSDPTGPAIRTGVSGDAVSRYARMAAVCDFYDKATCPPAGVEKWPSSHALDHLRAGRGEFDDQVVRAFVRVVGAFPPGALVRLRSDRLGVVLDESQRDPLHPVVAVFRHVGGGIDPAATDEHQSRSDHRHRTPRDVAFRRLACLPARTAGAIAIA